MRKLATKDLRMKEAIHVDWKLAKKEAQDLMDGAFDLPWDEKIHRIQVASEVLHQCDNADDYGYFELIEKYRQELKGSNVFAH